MKIFDILGVERETFSLRYDGHAITITERGSVRTLKVDGLIYSRIDGSSLYTHEYWDFFIPLPYLYKNPRVLMIGLGGGTIAKQFSELFGTGVLLEIVEVDKRMAEVCARFLGHDVRYRTVICDGAEYVAKSREAYEVIVLDAYEPGGGIPQAFMERKFVDDAYAALVEEGILAVNCIGSMVGPALDSFVQNLSEKFEVYRADSSKFTANVILVCSKKMSREEIARRIRNSDLAKVPGSGFLVDAYEHSRRVFITV